MISGGTGITPVFQVIQSVLLNDDDVQLALLFGNKSEDDILLKDKLDILAEKYPNKFKLIYIIDKAIKPEEWKGETGYVTKEILQKYEFSLF